MSTQDLGNQVVNIDYNENFTSENYNKRMNRIAKPGVYQGGTLDYSAPNVSILPFVCEFRTSGGQSVRIETSSSVTSDTTQPVSDTNPVVPTYAKPYVVGNFSWQNSENNFIDFSAKSAGELYDNDIIFGKVNFESGEVFQDITYDEKTWGAYDQDGNSYSNTVVIQSNEAVPSGAVETSGLVITSDVEAGGLVGFLNGRKIHIQYTEV